MGTLPGLGRLVGRSAAAAVVAAIVAVPKLTGTKPGEPLAVEGQRESQALEREWHSLTPVSARPSVDVARLRIIDAALQSAYDRGADSDELAPLWKERNEALRGLILTAQADTVTRI